MRCFIALRLYEADNAELARIIERLRREDAAVRWVPAANLHATLKFLGEVDDGQIEPLRTCLRDLTPDLRLGLDRLGCFPNAARPRVLWAGLHGDVQQVVDLAAAIDRRTQALGFAREVRAFTPHVTIGRVKAPRGVQGLLQRMAKLEVRTEPSAVGGFGLYRSVSTPAGQQYELLGWPG